MLKEGGLDFAPMKLTSGAIVISGSIVVSSVAAVYAGSRSFTRSLESWLERRVAATLSHALWVAGHCCPGQQLGYATHIVCICGC